MGYMSDIQSTYLAADGDIFTGRTRVKAVYVSPDAGVGEVAIRDGGSGGTVLYKIDVPAGSSAIYMSLPEDGILFKNGAYADLTDVISATFFWA
jgi:hypothetical protein